MTGKRKSFLQVLNEHSIDLSPLELSTLQINVGKLCNLACLHCHVEAGPKRTELMTKETFDRILQLIDASPSIKTVDVTGGSPEMNPHFKFLVKEVRKRGIDLIDRLNPTIFYEEGYEDIPKFLASNGVIIVASLPCYSQDNVDAQRGRDVFDKSIRALQSLNELGYGRDDSDLQLHLVYNPLGASLPPAQENLQSDYKVKLFNDFGIVFNQLFTITNMPIKRFRHQLRRDGTLDNYMSLLADNFNPSAVEHVMCRNLISISWEGEIFDCDFNQMLEMKPGKAAANVWEINSFSDLLDRKIALADHCFGCTAGAGSSCTGTLVES